MSTVDFYCIHYSPYRLGITADSAWHAGEPPLVLQRTSLAWLPEPPSPKFPLRAAPILIRETGRGGGHGRGRTWDCNHEADKRLLACT
jgi:hypothetical protein